MKIAMLSPIAWRTPPRQYGPWEHIVSLLTEGLVKRGIDVTLFATADSKTAGALHAICPRPYEEDKTLNPKVWECLHISELFERADEFDLIHNHFDFLPLSFCGLVQTPVVTTIHGFSSPNILPVYRKYNDKAFKAFYVSISDADRSSDLDYIATVHHGIDVDTFSFNENPDDYLLFLGRIHPDKGTRQAVEIAKKAGMKLRMAGFIHDQQYFEKEIKPLIDNEQIIYEGHVSTDVRNTLLAHAVALLHPINFAEPFGLTVIESMACGTPVIAHTKGSMPELIRNGENGFLVENAAQAVRALKRISEISRRRCRQIAEEHFSVDRMVDDYIAIYESIVSKCKREDHRPWGFYEVLSDKPDHKVKRITVFSGKRLSLQRHRQRREHWHIIKGCAQVVVDESTYAVSAGESIDIPRGAAHRIINSGNDTMVFIEIQEGDYFGEDDIERLEDDYGRT
jgi:glycosyltransferase involved in cell wall biosynthesis/quercetin dioxygenase-like cupin family protein